MSIVVGPDIIVNRETGEQDAQPAQARYLRPDVAAWLRMALQRIADPITRADVINVVEATYVRGYGDGYERGHGDGIADLNAQADATLTADDPHVLFGPGT